MNRLPRNWLTALMSLCLLCAPVHGQQPRRAADGGQGARDSSQPRVAQAEAVLARLRQQVGASPIECGRHRRQGSPSPPDSYVEALTASVRCVLGAARQRRPSWMLVELPGIDSWIAIGLISTSEGLVRSFDYDSDPSGGSGVAPRMALRPCQEPTVNLRGGSPTIDCGARR